MADMKITFTKEEIDWILAERVLDYFEVSADNDALSVEYEIVDGEFQSATVEVKRFHDFYGMNHIDVHKEY